MSLFKADGTRLLNLRVPPGLPIPTGRATDAGLSAAWRAGKVFISDVVVSSTSGKPTVFVGVPVFRNQAPVYGITATMEFDVWTDGLRQRIPEVTMAAIDDAEVRSQPGHDREGPRDHRSAVVPHGTASR